VSGPPAPQKARLAICSGNPMEKRSHTLNRAGHVTPPGRSLTLATQLTALRRCASKHRRETVSRCTVVARFGRQTDRRVALSLHICNRIAASLPRCQAHGCCSHLDSFAGACCTCTCWDCGQVSRTIALCRILTSFPRHRYGPCARSGQHPRRPRCFRHGMGRHVLSLPLCGCWSVSPASW
jgi:hypothetical protein